MVLPLTVPLPVVLLLSLPVHVLTTPLLPRLLPSLRQLTLTIQLPPSSQLLHAVGKAVGQAVGRAVERWTGHGKGT